MLRKTRNNLWLFGFHQRGSYAIYSFNGILVKTGTVDMTNGEPAIISTINFSSGMYVLEFSNHAGTQYLFFNHHK